ncbi:hypothetical protein K438DRAFT_1836202 [Mycena galopus ATCC 62051]|nr:hypothetical protein K438DRAFT_1836202 [Mycena galopus ATCC 62051]
MRATDTEVSRLAASLDNLTVEVRLGTHDTRRSPSPSNTDADDIQELFYRVRDLGTADKDLILRVASLEHRTPVAGDLTAATLSRALATLFADITSDRDVLNRKISRYADQLAALEARHQLELESVQNSLRAVEATIARLELGLAPRLRMRSRSPRRALSTSNVNQPLHRLPRPRSPIPRALRARSPAPEMPAAKRARNSPSFITVGPFAASNLSPTELFKSLLSRNIPTFTFTEGYTVELDRQYSFHLRVTLFSAADMDALLYMWGTGARLVGMREIPSVTENLNDSVSATRERSHVSGADMRGSKD